MAADTAAVAGMAAESAAKAATTADPAGTAAADTAAGQIRSRNLSHSASRRGTCTQALRCPAGMAAAAGTAVYHNKAPDSGRNRRVRSQSPTRNVCRSGRMAVDNRPDSTGLKMKRGSWES
ncbi:hypothetical protein FACS1894184_03780 [Clostridia bacterium]|nr:hypothetical protein FACS1894184_03780 [Clostridia bacterium]